MDAISFLKSFAIDYWYKMLIAACLALMVISLTMKIYAIPNTSLFALSLGGFLIGLGEWINHPCQERINLKYSFKVTSYPRKPTFGGIALDGVGAVVLAVGAFKAMLAVL